MAKSKQVFEDEGDEKALPTLEDHDGTPLYEGPDETVDDVEEEIPQAATAAVPPGGDDTQTPPVAAAISAPNTWSGEAKAEWAKLPKTVQEVVLKREKEIHAGIEQYRGKAELGNAFEQLVTPYVPALRATGQEPLQALGGILQTVHQLRIDPYRTMLGIMRDYGVDPQQLMAFAGIQGGQQQETGHNPLLNQVLNQQQQMQAYLQHAEMQRRQADEAQANEQISSFSSDPKNEFFADPQVRETMGRLMQAGTARGMQDAYEQATYIVPHVRAQLEARRTTNLQAETTQKLRQKAANAKRANVDVVDDGSNPFPTDGADDLSATLRKNFRRFSATG